MNARPCVSVIIVTYESSEHIGRCLASLKETAYDWLRDIIVVDNASSDGSADIVASLAPDATLLRNSENLGFGRAMNQGAREGHGEYLLLLNPDCTADPNAVAELAHFLDHRVTAGACGPKMVDLQGQFQYSSRRGFPTPLNSFAYFSRLDRIFPRSHSLGGYQRRHLDPRFEVETDSLSGACMLVRTEMFQLLGGFDEDYFLFGDDIDLCWKIRHAGYEIWYVPSARVMHVKGASMVKHSQVAQREFYRSMHIFIEKRLRGKYSFVSLALVKLGVAAAELWTKIRGGR